MAAAEEGQPRQSLDDQLGVLLLICSQVVSNERVRGAISDNLTASDLPSPLWRSAPLVEGKSSCSFLVIVPRWIRCLRRPQRRRPNGYTDQKVTSERNLILIQHAYRNIKGFESLDTKSPRNF